jgi:hypothetical protein
MGVAAITKGTGKDWNTWCDLIEQWPGHQDGHAAIAAWIHQEFGIDHWWAQGVTVGWERITGRRVPGQMADGSFSVSKSRTLPLEANWLRAELLDDEARQSLIPGLKTELRSKPSSKNIRINVTEGSILFSINETAAGRAKVTITHERLTSVEANQRWRFY